MKNSGWYRIAMAFVMLIVLVNTWLAVRALNTLFVTQGWRAHALEVLTHTRALELGVAQGNGAVRAYLLTGDPRFVAQFTQAKVDIDNEVAQIAHLTGDNQAQQRRIGFLRARIRVKRAALEAGVAMRRGADSPLDAAMVRPILADSPDNGPSVSYCIQEIENEEQRLLIQRTSETNHAQAHVWWSFAGATLLDIALLAIAAELLIRAGRDRQNIAAKALQTANVQLEDRVAQRTRELALSNQELEAFSYSVSHDLRAPLRTIDGFSLALMEDFSDKLNEEGRDYITRVRSGVQRMGTLIDALLQLSRVTRTELQTEHVDLSSLATLVFNELAASDTSRHVQFTAQPGVFVEGDSRLLRIALENLIGNAWKFTARTKDAHIEFGSRLEGGTAIGETRPKTVYFVRDNGAGFDMQYVDRLFTAFQRLHGDRDFKGSGIGLATVSRIIRRHHGTISAEGAPGLGATFYFHLAG
jgi:signal transduction histidine kinase